MPGAGWRQHVRAELQRRERRARGLRLLLERHEKLYGRLDALQTLLTAAEEEGQWPAAVGSCRPPQEVASVRVQQEMELIELRKEREELHQRVALLTDILREAEAENKEQRAKTRRLAQDLAALTRRHEEAQCQAWALSQEAKGLRRELAEAQGLMREAQRKREELEACWVREKALEAGRLNQANEQHERYQRRVRRLQEKLQEAREAAGMIPRPAAAELSPSDSTSCEETSTEGGSSSKFLSQRICLPVKNSPAKLAHLL
ncbi:autophagy-related protein 16-like isoform X3 [Podarcis raffonei]|uniref:autophagy-related protein 16-like isoform X3 n=1 Tax=Podarcis raffonei TaxID=65483 RepID=UPI0023293BB1|nr:autophagy-related protein 16-like isoform X3 [Podarcis raffonei]